MGDDGARQLSFLFGRGPVRWDEKAAAYRIELSDNDRAVLRELAPQMVALLDQPDHPIVQRLFPPAYNKQADAQKQDEFRHYMLDDLVQRHREEFDLLAETADAKSLTEEQLLAWSRAINSIRLILGTYLDVSEEDQGRPPETNEEIIYHWLSYLLEEAIEALGRQT